MNIFSSVITTQLFARYHKENKLQVNKKPAMPGLYFNNLLNTTQFNSHHGFPWMKQFSFKPCNVNLIWVMIYFSATHKNTLPFIIIISKWVSVPCGPDLATYIDSRISVFMTDSVKKPHNLIPITYSSRTITLHTTLNYILTEVAY